MENLRPTYGSFFAFSRDFSHDSIKRSLIGRSGVSKNEKI
jgi:hypothetical protein